MNDTNAVAAQNDDDALTFEISDETLEVAASVPKVDGGRCRTCLLFGLGFVPRMTVGVGLRN
jgi:hypothetical protein